MIGVLLANILSKMLQPGMELPANPDAVLEELATKYPSAGSSREGDKVYGAMSGDDKAAYQKAVASKLKQAKLSPKLDNSANRRTRVTPGKPGNVPGSEGFVE